MDKRWLGDVLFKYSVRLETDGGSYIVEVAKCDVHSNAPKAAITVFKIFVLRAAAVSSVFGKGKAPSAMALQQSRP